MKRLKAFTLMELMILLSLLTILMAAFAPVFTTRIKKSSLDTIWSYINGDSQYNIKAEGKKRFFVGVSPANKAAADALTTNASATTKEPLFIKSMKIGSYSQPQMGFRYGNNDAGVLLVDADNGNVMLGNKDKKVVYTGTYNTSLGLGNEISSDTSRNTIIGYNSKSTNNYNTIIGNNTTSSGQYNTLIGNNMNISGLNNAIVTLNANYSNASGSGNTIIGDAKNGGNLGDYNTLIGYNVMPGNTGSYNTVIGNDALLKTKENASYITAIGNGAGNYGDYEIGSNKTFIYNGYDGSIVSSNTLASDSADILEDDVPRVFIGGRPQTHKGVAVLEVHGVDTVNANSKPMANMGNESVVVNGNLVVRGQTYLGVSQIGYGQNTDGGNINNRPTTRRALVGYTIFDSSYVSSGMVANNTSSTSYTFGGYDGTIHSLAYTGNSNLYPYERSSNGSFVRQDPFNVSPSIAAYYSAAKGGCICTIDADKMQSGDTPGIGSYDWFSTPTGYSTYIYPSSTSVGFGIKWHDAVYGDLSFPAYTQEYRSGAYYRDYFGNHAHNADSTAMPYSAGAGCCPDIRSDVRLKNVSLPFAGGLGQIEKLKVYNYTYKNDVEKKPQVGVIAQDLKKVFSNAVRKNEKGYYEIRWDEIFYSAINAIKELDNKINSLIAKVEKNRKRLSDLQKENENLKKELLDLSNKLDALEK